MTPKRKQNRRKIRQHKKRASKRKQNRRRERHAARKRAPKFKLRRLPWPRHFIFGEKLRLYGALTGTGPRWLSINRHTNIHLDLRMFLVLLVLFSHGKKAAGKGAKAKVEVLNHPFLSAKEILDAILRLQDKYLDQRAVFKKEGEVGGDDGAIVMVIRQIRVAIWKKHFPPELIANGPEGRGYRLEVEHVNLHDKSELPEIPRPKEPNGASIKPDTCPSANDLAQKTRLAASTYLAPPA